MFEVIDLKVLPNYHIHLKFNDGEEKVIDFRPFIGKGVSAELLDPEKFSRVFIEPGGGLGWENGYDFCPNFLREHALESNLAI